MTFTDAQGTEYFIQASDAVTSSGSSPSKMRGKVGMFSCEESIPVYTLYRQEITFTSNIEGFNWKTLSTSTRSDDMASVTLSSPDKYFDGIIEYTNDHVLRALYKEMYESNNDLFQHVNVIVKDPTIPDSLFWNREQGFIKFTSRDKKQYFLKR